LNTDWQSDRESEQNQRRTSVVNTLFVRLSALVLAILLELAIAAQAQAPLDIKIGYLRRAQQQETISLVQMPPPDIGLAGAQMAVRDNNTTGRFLNQRYLLVDMHLKTGDDPAAAVRQLASQGVFLIVADLPADELLRAADAGKADRILFFNVASTDDRLRQKDCRGNIIHTAPSRAMLADGLAQYLVWKKWVRWFLVVGSHERDQLFAAALTRAATRFGAKIVQQREFKDTGGARRTDSGVAQIQQQMPVFTQEVPNYDVLVVADESEVFANTLPYRTWDPRPVAGSAGLVPTSWDASNGPVGRNSDAKSLYRTIQTADGPRSICRPWTAGRMVGEAASRQNSADPKVLFEFLKGPQLALGAFKGQKLTVRDWEPAIASAHSAHRRPDHRLGLAAGRLPAPSFSALDTLGYDRPETQCSLQ
jgi:ABC transporter substrate binding protein (PQQ-dependent alcohol dehydrogenase system)